MLEKYKFPVVGNTAASVALRQIKPGYLWFPTSAIPDRIGVELTAMLKAANVKSRGDRLQRAAVLEGDQELPRARAEEGRHRDQALDAEYPPDVKDMTATLTQVKQANVDAVIALAYPGDAVLYAKQAKELGHRRAVPVRRRSARAPRSSPRSSARRRPTAW